MVTVTVSGVKVVFGSARCATALTTSIYFRPFHLVYLPYYFLNLHRKVPYPNETISQATITVSTASY